MHSALEIRLYSAYTRAMRMGAFCALLLALCASAGAASARRSAPVVDEFTVGRNTFFDFGPPFNYYEIYIVKGEGDSVTVRRIYFSLGECTHQLKVEYFSATLRTKISDLFEDRNPCEISDRDLRRERKRHKHDPVFSGAVTTLQLQCGTKERRIRTDAYDRDWFAKDPGTPQNTSWTMRMLGKLNSATGRSPLDEPVFAQNSAPQPKSIPNDVLTELRSGRFDSLFDEMSVSGIFRDFQPSPLEPQVRIVSVEPVAPPLSPEAIPYPPLARAANVSGVVHVRLRVDSDGHAANIKIEDGHPLLKGVVEKSATKWRFDREFAGQDVRVTIEFNTNCELRQRID